MLIYSGFRPSEAFALTWEDVDFNENTIRINKTVTEDSKSIGTPKTVSSNRTIKINSHFVKELKMFRNTQQIFYWKVAGNNIKPKYVFTNITGTVLQNGGEWYSVQNFRNIWKGLCGRHNIPFFSGSTLHCFRHTHATTQLLNSRHGYEVKFKMVSKRLGHSDVFETIRTYHHLFPEQETSFDEDFDNHMNNLIIAK